MALLRNLKVDKVSFVQRPATKRKFLILKSAKVSSQKKKTTTVTHKKDASKKAKGEIKRMDAKLKKILKALVGTHKSVEDVMKALGESKDVELSEEQTSAAKDVVELMFGMKPEVETAAEKEAKAAQVKKASEEKAAAEKKAAEEVVKKALADPEAAAATALAKKAADDLADALSRTEKLEKQLAATERRTAITDIRREIDTDCPHFTGDATEAATYLYDLRKSDKKAAEFFMNTLKSASVVASNPDLFTEIGKSGESDLGTSQILGSNFITEIKKMKSAVAKSGVKKSEVEIITDAVRGMGGDVYEQYRHAHIRQAKRG